MVQPAPNRVSLVRTQTICLVILTTIAAGFSLYYLQPVLLPFVIAFFIVIGCQPILSFLETRLKLHWFVAFVVTFVIGMALLAALVLITWISINDLAKNAEAYQDRINGIVSLTTDLLERDEDSDVDAGEDESSADQSPETGNQAQDQRAPGSNSDADEPSGSDRSGNREPNSGESNGDETAGHEPLDANSRDDGDPIPNSNDDSSDAGPASNDGTNDAQTTDPVAVADDESDTLDNRRNNIDTPVTKPENPSEAISNLVDSYGVYAQQYMLSIAGSLTRLLSYAILVLIFIFFLLLGRATNAGNRPPIIDTIEEQISKYIVLKAVISFITGLITAVVLWIFGVPLAIVFGFLAMLLNFIPNIGPLICCALPVPFLVLNPEMSPWVAGVVFVLLCTIQFVSGNVVEPRVMGKSFDVSPIVLMMALMFFGLVWGIAGMFLATPIVSIIKIILQQNPSSKPVADWIAGRWDDIETDPG